MKPTPYFALLTALVSAAEGFVHNQHQSRMRVDSRTATLGLLVQGGTSSSNTALFVGDLPYGPPSGASSIDSNADGRSPAKEGKEGREEGGGKLRGNRFSKYAPDASLDTAEFREQLKENMKADLERRRREDPNRGNQPAKTYLDNL